MGTEPDPEQRRRLAELSAWHTEWALRWGVDDSDDGTGVPPEAEAEYQRRADEIMGVDRPAPAPQVPGVLPPPPVTPPHWQPRPPVARTRDEALFYLQLQRCPECGEQRTRWNSTMVEVDGALARRYTGACETCGQPREYVFGLPDRVAPRPPGATMHYGGDEPSQLIDAGQWLLLSEPAAEQTRADLAAGDRTAAARHAELAIACVTEVTKFIPPGESAVPASGFWTGTGRAAQDADPARFTLRRLLLLLDMLHDEFDPPLGRAGTVTAAGDRRAGQPHDPRGDAPATGSAPTAGAPTLGGPTGPTPPGPAVGGVPAGGAASGLPVGRTNAEMHLFLELARCACGSTTGGWRSRLLQVDAELVAAYTATCPECGRHREYQFRLPARTIPTGPEGAGFRYGDGNPSQLLDPGEWLLAADRLARSAQPLAPDADERTQAAYRYALGRAAAALVEVAAFAPPGAPAVPESALRTERGRAVYRAEPGRFRLARLAAVRSAYLGLLADAGL